MASGYYTDFKRRMWDYIINGTTARTMKLMLVNGYVPDFDAHIYKSSVTSEASGAGYTAGGLALSGLTLSADVINHRGALDVADPALNNSTITATGAVIYIDTGAAGTSPLVAHLDFGGAIVSTANQFIITVNALGLFTVS